MSPYNSNNNANEKLKFSQVPVDTSARDTVSQTHRGQHFAEDVTAIHSYRVLCDCLYR